MNGLGEKIITRIDILIDKLSINYVDWLIAIGTVGAVIVALAIAIFGERIKYKGKISLTLRSDKAIRTKQRYKKRIQGPVLEQEIEISLNIFRIELENNGDRKITDARAVIKNIFEFDGKSYLKRNNFISAPINWTHFGFKRDINVREPAYLDIIQKPSNKNYYEICWPDGRPHEKDLAEIGLGKKFILELEIYLEKKIIPFKLKFEPEKEELIAVDTIG